MVLDFFTILGIVVGIATIHIDENERTRPLRERYECRAAHNGPDL